MSLGPTPVEGHGNREARGHGEGASPNGSPARAHADSTEDTEIPSSPSSFGPEEQRRRHTHRMGRAQGTCHVHMQIAHVLCL